MTFLEALKSGKPFKALDIEYCKDYIIVIDDFLCFENSLEFDISNIDFFKADFELKKDPISLTGEDFDKVVNKLHEKTFVDDYKIFEILKKELGL